MPKSPNLPLTPEEQPTKVTPISQAQEQKEAIIANVLSGLGRPAHLFRVAVLPLWDNHFRVNVLTGELASSVAIPNSYFVTADNAGKILGSTPIIRKLY